MQKDKGPVRRDTAWCFQEMRGSGISEELAQEHGGTGGEKGRQPEAKSFRCSLP